MEFACRTRMGFLDMADWMVWPPPLLRHWKWPRLTTRAIFSSRYENRSSVTPSPKLRYFNARFFFAWENRMASNAFDLGYCDKIAGMHACCLVIGHSIGLLITEWESCCPVVLAHEISLWWSVSITLWTYEKVNAHKEKNTFA